MNSLRDTVVIAKVAWIMEPEHLAFESEHLDVRELRSDEILARTIVTAVSPGTERAAWVGKPSLRPGKAYPRVVGYCNVAEVLAVGADVTAYRVGDRVLSLQPHRSAFISPAQNLIARLPPEADAQLASTTYLFHLAYNALLKGGYFPGHRVAIVGLGTLGMMTVALAHALGGRVTAYSDQSLSRALAYDLTGIDVRPKAALGEEPYADLVVTTSDHWSDWRLALHVARREGTICVVGFPGRGHPAPDMNPLAPHYFYDKQLRIVACGYAPEADAPVHELRFTLRRNCEYLLELILAGRLPARRLVSGVSPWYQLPYVYANLAVRTDGPLTHLLDWKDT